MTLLLKNEGYPPAVIASLFMHLCLILFIFGREVERTDFVTIEDPVIIAASAIDINPQRLRRLERLELERAEADRLEQVRRERELREQREAQERQQAEQRRQQEAEAERLRQEELARQRQLEEDAERQRLAEERAREEALLQEQQRLAREQANRESQARELAGEQLVVAQYAALIKRIISQNWVIPPSARNGMTAIVQLQVVPTGEVVGASVADSSGNLAFDRSVIQGVERAERFPELQELDTGVFERNFRTFTLVFRPEDLLR